MKLHFSSLLALAWLGMLCCSVAPARAAFQKLGPLVYYANMQEEKMGTGTVVIILAPDSAPMPGMFVAASKKYWSMQELTSLDKLTDDPGEFSSAFFVFEKSSGTFSKMFLRDREYALPPNFVLNIGPLRVAKGSTSQSLAYISFTAWNKIISFLGFQMVANEESEKAVSVLEAYQPAPDLKPYEVAGANLQLGGEDVLEMRFPLENTEQDRCGLQGVKLLRQELLDDAINGHVKWNSLKSENPADFIHLRVGRKLLALGLNGVPVLIQEDSRLAYTNEVFCGINALDFR